MGSNATINPNNLELSPMRVKLAGVELGATLGNITIKPKYTLADLKADQFGSSVIDKRVSGFECTVEFEIAEIKDEAKWEKVFPHATLVGTAPNQRLIFASNLGDSARALAQLLTLHPLSMVDADLTQDYNFFLATATAESQIVYSPTEQSKLKIVLFIYPDFSTTPARYFAFGDPAIVGTNASFLAAVPGGGNVGGGTVTGIAVNNANTKTETITLLAVTAVAAGGVFSISGSVSGPLGLATVGLAFVSGPITFTINDGAPDFAVGDSFTIATTAAS